MKLCVRENVRLDCWLCFSFDDALRPPHASILRRLLGLFGILFESPGIYALAFTVVALERTEWLPLFYGTCGPIWFLFCAREYRYDRYE